MNHAKKLVVPEKLKINTVVLDLDGTLVDTHKDFLVALNYMLEDLDLPSIQENFVRATVGKGTNYLIDQTLRYVTGENRIALALREKAVESYLYHYKQINGTYSNLYPGVVDVLATLALYGYTLICLTNKPSCLAGPLLVKLELQSYFKCVFGGDAFARQKPDPLPLVRTCEAFGVAPEDVLMVGDSENDALAARRAHVSVALVRYGYNHGRPIDEVDADFYLDSLLELPSLLH